MASRLTDRLAPGAPSIDQPSNRGEWTLVAWELRRYHPGCVTAVVLDATASSPARRPGDPPPLYPPAPTTPAGGPSRFWWTSLPAAAEVPVTIWQPELAQPIVTVPLDVYPVGEVQLQRVARLGGEACRYGELVPTGNLPGIYPPTSGRCQARLLDGGVRVLERTCHLAVDAATALATAGYATAGDRLHEFREQVTPWEHTSAVVDLDERLAAVIA